VGEKKVAAHEEEDLKHVVTSPQIKVFTKLSFFHS